MTTNPSLKVAELVAGSAFTCALLLDDSVKRWADNGVGELGNGKKDGYAVGDDELPASVGPMKLLSPRKSAALPEPRAHGLA